MTKYKIILKKISNLSERVIYKKTLIVTHLPKVGKEFYIRFLNFNIHYTSKVMELLNIDEMNMKFQTDNGKLYHLEILEIIPPNRAA